MLVLICLNISLVAHFASATFGQEANQILNIFKSCLTDIISADTLTDIAESEYPILVSTPQVNLSTTTPPTFREGENVVRDSGYTNDFFQPAFRNTDSEIPKPIRVRFSCVALVLLGPRSSSDVRKSIQYRHNWIHSISYEYFAALYTGNVYINLLSREDFNNDILNKRIWLPPKYRWDTNPKSFALYLWSVPAPYGMSMLVKLKIILNPPCSAPIFFRNMSLQNLKLIELDRIFEIGIQELCHNLIFRFDMNDIETSSGEPIFHCGRPVGLSALIYPKDTLGQMLHKSAVLNILVSSFTNSSVAITSSKVLYSELRCLSLLERDSTIEIGDETLAEYFSPSIGDFFPTRSAEFKFITCNRPEGVVDFEVYLKPFRLEVWIALGLTLCLSTGFLISLLRLQGQREEVLLVLCSALVEHGYHIRAAVLKLRSFNVFMNLFLFMTIILTNGYKGIVITDITAPLGFEHVSTFDEAIQANYTLVTPNPPRRNQLLEYFHVYYTKNSTINESQLSEHFKNYSRDHGPPQLYFLSKFDLTVMAAGAAEDESYAATQILQFLRSIKRLMNSWFERDFSILVNGTEYEFLKCNKTILVDTGPELTRTLVDLNDLIHSKGSEYNLRLNMGTDGILKKSWGIYISEKKWDNGLLARRMSRLLSSGIYNQLKDFESNTWLKYLALKYGKSLEPSCLNLNTNILTLFAIYGTGIGMAVIWLIIEHLIISHSEIMYSCCLYGVRSENEVSILQKPWPEESSIDISCHLNKKS